MMSSMGRRGIPLERAAQYPDGLHMIRKADIAAGDVLIVKTCNSVYTMRSLGAGTFVICGGWFDRKGVGPCTTTVRGCTWGGSMIKVDVVAACGLCIEFGNRLTTSLVRSIIVMPAAVLN